MSIADELQRMRNWAESNGVLRLDWQATWRTWCDKAVEFGRTGSIRRVAAGKFDPIRYVNDPIYAAECDGKPKPEGGDHGRVIDAQSGTGGNPRQWPDGAACSLMDRLFNRLDGALSEPLARGLCQSGGNCQLARSVGGSLRGRGH